jgi:hypothetical protein
LSDVTPSSTMQFGSVNEGVPRELVEQCRVRPSEHSTSKPIEEGAQPLKHGLAQIIALIVSRREPCALAREFCNLLKELRLARPLAEHSAPNVV